VGTGEAVVAAADDEEAGLRADTGRDRWRRSYDTPVEGLAATGEGVVVATGNGLAAVAPRASTERWRNPADGTVVKPLSVGQETVVVVGLSSGDVLAAESGTGERRWRASVGTAPRVRPGGRGRPRVRRNGVGSRRAGRRRRLPGMVGRDGSPGRRPARDDRRRPLRLYGESGRRARTGTGRRRPLRRTRGDSRPA
jgi:hypothetical protein